MGVGGMKKKMLENSQVTYYYSLVPFLAHGILMQIIFVSSIHLAMLTSKRKGLGLNQASYISCLSLFKVFPMEIL